jgi:TonB family protein
MLISLLLLVAADPQASNSVLAPTSKWGLDIGFGCRMTRQFGPAETPTTLSVHIFPGGSAPTLAISTPGKAKANAMQISVGEAGQRLAAHFERENYAPWPNTLSTKLARHDLSLLLTSPTIYLSGLTRDPTTLDIQGSPNVLGAMSDCERRLSADWGIDYAQSQLVQTQAVLAQAAILTTDDYPAEARVTRQEGVNMMVYEVGPDAIVRNCKVVESSGFPLLDKASCDVILKRTRFSKPALDEAGNPVVSWAIKNVTWRRPG